jgi:hypothetical protein
VAGGRLAGRARIPNNPVTVYPGELHARAGSAARGGELVTGTVITGRRDTIGPGVARSQAWDGRHTGSTSEARSIAGEWVWAARRGAGACSVPAAAVTSAAPARQSARRLRRRARHCHPSQRAEWTSPVTAAVPSASSTPAGSTPRGGKLVAGTVIADITGTATSECWSVVPIGDPRGRSPTVQGPDALSTTRCDAPVRRRRPPADPSSAAPPVPTSLPTPTLPAPATGVVAHHGCDETPSSHRGVASRGTAAAAPTAWSPVMAGATLQVDRRPRVWAGG